ncbi:MAG: ATP-binding cassette domain-containing protein [bacterium]
MTAPAIQIEKVSAGYRETRVLKDLSLTVAEGEMVGILGPNGAGKSTLFKVLSGLLPPRSGTVRLFGQDVRRLPPAERARTVAVVPQDLDIPVPYTVEEVVMMGRTVSIGRLSRPTAHDHQVVERALVYTDVADIRHRPLNELSGGERQRAIVAMALAQEPRIVLMDEATSHLDINHRLEIMQLVERLNAEGGMTVLMISHDLQLAAEFSRRLILLDHGSLVADGKPAEVLTEEGVRRVYHCDVRVHQDSETGGLSILAPPRLPAVCAGKGIRIHVVAGGGCGEEVMRRLALCGYSLSSGVLNRGDLDTTVAEALGADTSLEQPFSPVSREALGSARELALKADAVVLAPVPFGTGNLVNLDLLEAARATGRPVFIAGGIEDRDFTPARDAVRRVRALIAGGATPWNDVAELLTLLPKGVKSA